MLKAGGGSIVNIGSIASMTALGRGHINGIEAVHLQIDEAGDKRAATAIPIASASIDWQRAVGNLDDPAALEHDAAILDHAVRQHETRTGQDRPR